MSQTRKQKLRKRADKAKRREALDTTRPQPATFVLSDDPRPAVRMTEPPAGEHPDVFALDADTAELAAWLATGADDYWTDAFYKDVPAAVRLPSNFVRLTFPYHGVNVVATLAASTPPPGSTTTGPHEIEYAVDVEFRTWQPGSGEPPQVEPRPAQVWQYKDDPELYGELARFRHDDPYEPLFLGGAVHVVMGVMQLLSVPRMVRLTDRSDGSSRYRELAVVIPPDDVTDEAT